MREDQANEKNSDSLDQSVCYPAPENTRTEKLLLDTDLVEEWLRQKTESFVLEVHDSPVETNGTRKANIVLLVDPSFIERLTTED